MKNCPPADSGERVRSHDNVLPLQWIAIAITGLAIVLLFVGRWFGWGAWQTPTALTASTGFVLVALLGGAMRHRYGRLVLAALVCCWTWDVVGPVNFQLGALAFLVAHLLLIPAILTRKPHYRLAAAAALATVAVSGASLVMFWPSVPANEQALILAYSAIISVMVSLALGAGTKLRLLPSAAVLFYVSDLFVARWRYLEEDWNGLVCYPLYYTACLLFACTVANPSGARRDLPDVAGQEASPKSPLP